MRHSALPRQFVLRKEPHFPTLDSVPVEDDRIKGPIIGKRCNVVVPAVASRGHSWHQASTVC